MCKTTQPHTAAPAAIRQLESRRRRQYTAAFARVDLWDGACNRRQDFMTRERRTQSASPVNRPAIHSSIRPWHLARHMLSRGAALVPLGIGTLALGMAIYHWVERLPWPDAFLNAAMLLG